MPTNPEFDVDHEFEALLDYLKRSRGFDFTGYKRSSLMRRVDKRMQMLEVSGYGAYLDYLEVHPDEFAQLFNTILINVTAFFRDQPSWAFLREDVVPRLLEGKPDGEPIRVWSAGCASGEEAYTLAMVLAEALGAELYRERVKIYATDIDEDALQQARQASYSDREVVGVPPELLERYFERQGARYVVKKELRRGVIFGRHDLIQDAPISRLNLIVCRNALMYFNAEVQAKILARLHFALSEGGFLFLGKAEMLFMHTSLFLPLDLKRRIFTKVPKGQLRDRLMLMAQAESEQEVTQLADHVRMREVVFDYGLLPQIVVDMNGGLALVNERARALFRLSPRDIGRPLQDLEISYRPVELRSCIEQVYADRRPIVVKEVQWPPSITEAKSMEVQVQPLLDIRGTILGVSISFQDVTRYKQLQEELQESSRELETAYEELQSTNEELETTNEELQSTVEELETTNEELQSTNEELETMNEELQSTNEELQTLNDELRLRGGELNQVNTYLSSILSSLQSGVVVLDRDLQVQIWNRQAEDLWGMRAEEVRQTNFLNLDIGLPVDQLKPAIRACLAGESEMETLFLCARNRRGKTIACRVICSPLSAPQDDFRGVILLMEEDAEQGEAKTDS